MLNIFVLMKTFTLKSLGGPEGGGIRGNSRHVNSCLVFVVGL